MLLKHLPLFFFVKVSFSALFCRPFCSSCVCCCITATLLACLSLLASPCLPLFACLSLLASSCSPLPARLPPCPLVLSFLLLCMLLYHSNLPCSPFLARPSLLALRLVPWFSRSSCCVCCCITATLLSPVLWRPLSPVASPLRKKIL